MTTPKQWFTRPPRSSTMTSRSIAGMITTFSLAEFPTALASSLLQKRATVDSGNLLLSGKVPEGFIILVGGGLGVAAIALIFVLLQSRLPSNSRRVRDERTKARTDLRLRGGLRNGNPNGSPGVSSSALHSASPPSDTVVPTATPMSDMSGSSSDIIYKSARKPSGPRGYSGSSFSRGSMHEMSYSSFTSMRDLPFLANTGRLSFINSELPKGAFEDAAKAHRPGLHYLQNQRHNTPRDRHSRLAHQRSGDTSLHRYPSARSSLYRGTNLHLTRTHSGGLRQSYNAAAVDGVYNSADTGGAPPARRQHPLEVSRGADSPPDNSRRNSSSALLDDDYNSTGPSTAGSSHLSSSPSPFSNGSSSEDSSALLRADHPLSSTQQQQQPSKAARVPVNAAAAPKQGHYITSNYHKRQGFGETAGVEGEGQSGAYVPSRLVNSQASQASGPEPWVMPTYPGTSATDMTGSRPSSHDHSSLRSYNTTMNPSPLMAGHHRADEESLISVYERSRPGEFVQPVVQGNGRRGVPGSLVGSGHR